MHVRGFEDVIYRSWHGEWALRKEAVSLQIEISDQLTQNPAKA
jgi:hypothetical protein